MTNNENVWDADELGNAKLVLRGETLLQSDEISAADVKSALLSVGIRKFTLKDCDGVVLVVEDFPITSGTITAEEHNEAK